MTVEQSTQIKLGIALHPLVTHTFMIFYLVCQLEEHVAVVSFIIISIFDIPNFEII